MTISLRESWETQEELESGNDVIITLMHEILKKKFEKEWVNPAYVWTLVSTKQISFVWII